MSSEKVSVFFFLYLSPVTLPSLASVSRSLIKCSPYLSLFVFAISGGLISGALGECHAGRRAVRVERRISYRGAPLRCGGLIATPTDRLWCERDVCVYVHGDKEVCANLLIPSL